MRVIARFFTRQYREEHPRTVEFDGWVLEFTAVTMHEEWTEAMRFNKDVKRETIEKYARERFQVFRIRALYSENVITYLAPNPFA